jgi:hypothetical protein
MKTTRRIWQPTLDIFEKICYLKIFCCVESKHWASKLNDFTIFSGIVMVFISHILKCMQLSFPLKWHSPFHFWRLKFGLVWPFVSLGSYFRLQGFGNGSRFGKLHAKMNVYCNVVANSFSLDIISHGVEVGRDIGIAAMPEIAAFIFARLNL